MAALSRSKNILKLALQDTNKNLHQLQSNKSLDHTSFKQVKENKCLVENESNLKFSKDMLNPNLDISDLKSLQPVLANDQEDYFKQNNNMNRDYMDMQPLQPVLTSNQFDFDYQDKDFTTLQPLESDNYHFLRIHCNSTGHTSEDLQFLQPVSILCVQDEFEQNSSSINIESNNMSLQALQSLADDKQKSFDLNDKNQENQCQVPPQLLTPDYSSFLRNNPTTASTQDADLINTEQPFIGTDISSNNSDDIEHDSDWILSTNSDVVPDSDKIISNIPFTITNTKKEYKRTYCTFCESFIISKHFSRHLQQRHKEKSLVKLLLDDKGSKEKNNIIMMIRNKGNLKVKERNGTIIPKKSMKSFSIQTNDSNYMICAKCKGFFKTTYLVRHNRKCFVTKSEAQWAHPKVESFILSLETDYSEHLKKDPLKKQLLKKLRLDEIGKGVISDPIILEYGLQLLQTNKNITRRSIVVRNKMRECARILIEVKKLIPESSNSVKTVADILKPKNIDYLVQAVKNAGRYTESTRSYGSASYALHQGKTIKDLIDIVIYLICKKDKIINIEYLSNSKDILDELNLLRKMIQENWGRLVGSLALKDLNTSKSKNHTKKLLPLTEDVMKLRKYCIEKALTAVKVLKIETNILQYKILVEVTFLLLLLHNRKRVGDIQFIELSDVTKLDTVEQTDEVLQALSPTERVLTKLYKKIHTIGKGSKDVLVLVPRDIQNFIDVLITERIKYINSSNKYFFPNCNGSDEWLNGCYIQAKLSKECGAKLPHLIRSSKLRKHIATMMQLMDLRDNEIGQVASFMGHTEKTHREFYRLPRDVLMIAKVSKILLKLEKGEFFNCKDKRMEEIDIEINDPEFSEFSSEEEFKSQRDFSISIASHGSQRKTSECPGRNLQGPHKVLKSSDEEEILNNTLPPNKKLCQTEKRKWTSDETNSIKTHFKKYLNKDSLYPSAAETVLFANKYLTSERTVSQIKSKIQYIKRQTTNKDVC